MPVRQRELSASVFRLAAGSTLTPACRRPQDPVACGGAVGRFLQNAGLMKRAVPKGRWRPEA